MTAVPAGMTLSRDDRPIATRSVGHGDDEITDGRRPNAQIHLFLVVEVVVEALEHEP